MKRKICAVTTRDMTMKSFMVDTLNFFYEKGFDVIVICEPSEVVKNSLVDGIKYYPIKMKSGIESPFRIVSIIMELIKIFKKEKIDIIQYASTNAGLYAAVAAKLIGIPNRIFCQWGMMYVGSTGFTRKVYKSIEKSICRLSTSVQSDSESNAEFAISERVVNRKKCEVVWNGSSTGVNTNKFEFIDMSSKEIILRRKELGLQKNSFVFGFVGRINREKGIAELLEAYTKLRNELPEGTIELVMVGPLENEYELNQKLTKICKKDLSVHYYGMSHEVYKYYGIMNSFVLPSYREGIATVLLEACATGLPILSSKITGSIDVVEDGYNGYLFEAKSSERLYECMKKIVSLESDGYTKMRKNSRKIAVEKYDHDKLVDYIFEDRNMRCNRSEKYD